MPKFQSWHIYAKQEFLTPGEVDTLIMIERLCPIREDTRVLEVAFGKGEAACRLAARHRCRVVGVDVHPFAGYAVRKARARRLADRVDFLRGDGGQLPVPDSAFDVAVCLGAPSIVGAERCLAEMRRALRPGGWLAISDWIWRRTPVPPEAIPRGNTVDTIVLDEYAATVRRSGFEVILAYRLPSAAWEEYFGPMLEVQAEIRERYPDDPEAQAFVAHEESHTRIFYDGLGRRYWAYAVFIARKLS